MTPSLFFPNFLKDMKVEWLKVGSRVKTTVEVDLSYKGGAMIPIGTPGTILKSPSRGLIVIKTSLGEFRYDREDLEADI